MKSNEVYAIQQLISLGISEQSATRVVIENLCFSQHYQEAQSLIDAYEAKYEGEEMTTQVVRNFSGIVSRYKSSKTTGLLIIRGNKK
jgi:hypothetical protein